MKSQDLLLKTIRKKLIDGNSLIDEIATILNISYDASHRRVSLKSKFSIEEAVQLCMHYDISMDSIIRPTNKIVVEKTSSIEKLSDLGIYLKESFEQLKEFKNKPNTTLYYSAKDIPLFYTIGGTLLSKFKLYVWSNLLIDNTKLSPFEDFFLTEGLLEFSSELQNLYNAVQVYEIWNDTTINSTVQQIFYFFESGLIKLDTSLKLFDDLKAILKLVEDKCNTTSNFNLYYNELIILNNNVLISNEEKIKLFVPYTILGYFIAEDERVTKNSEVLIKHQIKNSKSLNLSGTRDRKIFFNKANQKIEFYINKIKNDFNENIF